jgi:hypothetical protein
MGLQAEIGTPRAFLLHPQEIRYFNDPPWHCSKVIVFLFPISL